MLKTLLAIIGPGLIVMAGDNDAGAFAIYGQAGQDYGTTLLWTLLLPWWRGGRASTPFPGGLRRSRPGRGRIRGRLLGGGAGGGLLAQAHVGGYHMSPEPTLSGSW
ncbi:hypothetical protein [Nonomuraea sp. CA-141351]|uniref:hypothetical protein n=1 Tax=Nonomuraea sp. CA-141351 TaxID=3239996 RepID=UPI003D8A7DE3